MTTDTDLRNWKQATKELRKELTSEAYDRFLAEEMAAAVKAGKRTAEQEATFPMRKKALNLAEAHALSTIWKTREHGGIQNPTWSDEEWGYGGQQAEDKAEAENAAELEALAKWLAEQKWSEFAQSLASQYAKTKSLSPRQVESAKSMRDKVEAKAKAKAAVRSDLPSDIDLTDLPSGYYAVPGGDTRLKVRVARPTKASRWYGWTFVSDGAEYGARKNYGKQAPSGKYQGEIQDALRSILANPLEAQKAYGKLTGTCGRCGRTLEDAESIANGIGPICAEKW